MIVRPAAGIAVFPPTANVAVQLGIGIGLRSAAVRHGRFEALLDEPVIREEIACTIWFAVRSPSRVRQRG